MYLQNLLSK